MTGKERRAAEAEARAAELAALNTPEKFAERRAAYIAIARADREQIAFERRWGGGGFADEFGSDLLPL